jgi:hypothetical protein
MYFEFVLFALTLCIMKQVAILLLLMIILIQSSINFVIVVYYQLNKDYIAANLCENKYNTNIECNGKCYLNKKIKEHQQPIPSVLKEINKMVLYCSFDTFIFFNVSYFIKKVVHATYLIHFYKSPFLNIFQPPK